MADDSRNRPFILEWRSAVLNSQQTSTGKLCLLTLAEWADADGGNCYPTIPSIASRASVNEKTVRRCLDQAEAAGFIKRTHKGSAQGWRRFVYLPIVPKGADTTPARSQERAGTESAPSPPTCGLSVPNVWTLCSERAGTESTDLSITYPLSRNEDGEAITSDATRPVDLWGDGIRLLTDAGTPRDQAGATIGKLRKELGEDDALAAVQQMLAIRPTGPKTYLYGIINSRKAASRSGRVARDTRTEEEIAQANEAELARMEAGA